MYPLTLSHHCWWSDISWSSYATSTLNLFNTAFHIVRIMLLKIFEKIEAHVYSSTHKKWRNMKIPYFEDGIYWRNRLCQIMYLFLNHQSKFLAALRLRYSFLIIWKHVLILHRIHDNFIEIFKRGLDFCRWNINLLPMISCHHKSSLKVMHALQYLNVRARNHMKCL